MHWFNVKFPTKFQLTFFIEVEKCPKSYMLTQKAKNSPNQCWSKKVMLDTRGITTPNFKLYYRIIITKPE
jgi:hypothetical protein